MIYGKVVAEEALKLLGVGVGEVSRGESALSGSSTRPFTDKEAEHARRLGQARRPPPTTVDAKSAALWRQAGAAAAAP